MLRQIAVAAVAATFALTPAAQACTIMRIIAKDGGVIYARTMEFELPVPWQIAVLPAGSAITGTLPDGKPGISYKTRYGMAGAIVEGMPSIVDGLNDQGLTVSALWLPGFAGYTEATAENASRAMGPHEFGNWVLGNFATVDEVKAAVDQVVLVPDIVAPLTYPPPLHFMIIDKTGKAIVVEPIDGKLNVHDNPIGVLTNSPPFPWHVTNLRNYVNLTAIDVPPISLDSIKLAPPGLGSGMRGLPGDFTPPSRFVRAVFFSQALPQPETTEKAVYQGFHLLNAFDIPYGAVREPEGGTDAIDYTQWSTVADTKNLRWYYRTYDDQTIRVVDLKQALAAAGDTVRLISMEAEPAIVDSSTAFQ
jgi:choloylglycine hydrolase